MFVLLASIFRMSLMARLEYRTAGESHGQALIALIEGLPAGCLLDIQAVDHELLRRQGAMGGADDRRSRRMSPICCPACGAVGPLVRPCYNLPTRDYRIDEAPEVNRPRPGHADLAGSLKWLTTIAGRHWQRASARETAARVDGGGPRQERPGTLRYSLCCFVTRIGEAVRRWQRSFAGRSPRRPRCQRGVHARPDGRREHDGSHTRVPSRRGYGGRIVEARVFGCPPGLGSRGATRTSSMAVDAGGWIDPGYQGRGDWIGFLAWPRFMAGQVHDAIDFDAARRDHVCAGFHTP